MAKKWTHKVVKVQRGGDGKWFNYRAAATFTSEASAVAYAKRFASEQCASGITGTRIVVRSRKKGPTLSFSTEECRKKA